ncbi:aminotransferase class III-fold pyridoxal phosphate-dependent enzyme [Ferrovibrio sp.]|uniref:aminotransferase class III-fold pyridoxal phosphate-dependent enzyme n=1 Tax=Ferrovibrio sp. TaxID=1917215 RepID=UPI0025B9A8F4|nr:aminotransferase class III-fold pyridoxal phosphate-dependent enzyme [Ferrovibrio sp.]MBX3456286.1 aminotransferase class III-fold pyridoxal phosphate-dependent enzyme [Ferrovibrio sp.]
MQSGHGAHVVDVDGNRFVDYVLGLLPIVLGYTDPDVDAAVREQLDRGVSFSLATPLEADLADRLIRLIPCAEMVRYGKNGSDVTTAAIRLARAYTGRDEVAVLGYHGWHDWYIGTTPRNAGVPEAVKRLTHAVPYNDADALEDLLRRRGDKLAAVILEPSSKTPPLPGYLQRLRELTQRHGVLLVFDEIITGFRIGMGGAQAYYGVTPDLACFGKAMANGLPLSTLVGRADIMRDMDKIFFSTTFGGEALSLAAAIATIDKLERENGPERMWRLGERLIAAVNGALSRHGLANQISMGGEGWWPRLTLHPQGAASAEVLGALLRQELAERGILFSASFNLCLAQDDPAVEAETLAAFDGAAAVLREALAGPDPRSALRGPLVAPGFSVR